MREERIHARTGLAHGLINQLANSVKDDGFKRFDEKDRASMEKLKKDDAKMIKVQYLHKDGGVERLERPYCNWPGDPITQWRFIHGEIYEIPQGLLRDVNDPAKRTKKRSGLVDSKGNVLESDQLDEPIHRFVPASF